MDPEHVVPVKGNPSNITTNSTKKTLSKAKINSIIKLFSYSKKEHGFASASELSVSSSHYSNHQKSSIGGHYPRMDADIVAARANTAPVILDNTTSRNVDGSGGAEGSVAAPRHRGKELLKKMANVLGLRKRNRNHEQRP